MRRLAAHRPLEGLLFRALCAVLALGAARPASGAAAPEAPIARLPPAAGRVQVRAAAAQDVSAPLTLQPPAAPLPRVEHAPLRFRRRPQAPAAAQPGPAAAQPGPLAASAPSPLVATGNLNVYPGLGDGFSSANGIFADAAHPPDTDGDIGPKHFVQVVNDSLAVFERTGALLYGPVPTNTLWAGFDPHCASHNDGDAVVLYDGLADRWFITQFSVPSTGPWYQCVAVSRTPDPTGQYARYAFAYDGFNDYGKFGVWPDAYYATYNVFAGSSGGAPYRGALACAFDRASMLAGTLATQQCFALDQADALGPLYGGLLPADLDGSVPPPAGAPNPMVSFDGTANLQVWQFHVDWVDPSKSTLNGNSTCTTAQTSCPPTLIAVAPYTPLCNSSSTGTCIPQPGVQQELDSLGDRPMFRLAYRNFGDHESLLMTHSVQLATTATASGIYGGVRWYELRAVSAAGGPTVFQQGTWAPDTNSRWLGSLAMDGAGDVALLYSVSGASQYPGIWFTARGAGDAAGSMGPGETSVHAGSGAQGASAYAGSDRWGDYANLSIDPTDDCTFWATDEYIPANGNWRTSIASFQVGGCASLGLALPAPSAVVTRGSSVQVPVSVSGTAGASATLAVAGLPAGVIAAFVPPTVTVPGTAQLQLTADTTNTQSLQGVPLRVSAAAGGQTRSAGLSLDVRGNEFSLAGAPQATTLPAGATRSIAVQTQLVNGAAEPIALSIPAPPAGVQVSFSPASVVAGGSSTLTVASASPSDLQAKLAVVAQAQSSTHTLFLDLVTLVAPTASLLSPGAGTRLSGGADFILKATVSPSTTLSRLELLVDGQPFGALSASGSLHVDTGQLPNGARLFSVRATDAAGGTGVSAAVSMTVDNPKGCGCSGAGGAPDAAALLVPVALAALALRRRFRRA